MISSVKYFVVKYQEIFVEMYWIETEEKLMLRIFKIIIQLPRYVPFWLEDKEIKEFEKSVV